jgi:hypothetical protein
MITPNDLSSIIKCIAAGEHTEDDLQVLHCALTTSNDQNVLPLVSQHDKFNTNLGQITGGEVYLGDRIYPGNSAEAS